MAHRGHATDLGAANGIAQLDGTAQVPLTQLPGSAGKLDNLSAVVAPTITDDSNLGYSIGSRWIDTATDLVYECADASVSAAVWKNLTASASGQTIYDAIVPDDFATPGVAFAGGAKSVLMKGAITETQNVIIPNGGQLIGEDGTAVLDLATFSVQADGSGGTKQTAGTIAVTNNSAAVVGTGTTFTALSAGDFLMFGPTCFEIASITDNLNLTLVKLYRGNTRSGLSYIGQTFKSDIIIENIQIKDSTGIGLFLRAARNTVVRNVIVDSCVPPIQIIDSCDVNLDVVAAVHGTGAGIEIQACRSVQLKQCHVQNNTLDGVTLTSNSLGIHIVSSFIDSNGDAGIDVVGTTADVFISDCAIQQNIGKGVNTIGGTSRCMIEGSSIEFNGSDGIDYDGSQNSIKGCSLGNNGGHGVQAGDRGIVVGNHIHDNSLRGINLDFDTNTLVAGNLIEDNTGDGVRFNQADNCIVANNQINNNTGIGINILAAAGNSNNQVYGNEVSGNGTNFVNGGATTLWDSRNTGSGLTGPVLNTHDQTTNPTATDDINSGYQVGSRWVNVTDDTAFVCLDNTATAAVWKKTTSEVDNQAAQATADATTTDTGATWGDLAGATLTTAGTGTKGYQIVFTGNFENGSANQDVLIRLMVNGVAVANSVRQVRPSKAGVRASIDTNHAVDIPTGQIVKVQWQVTGGTGTVRDATLTFLGIN